MLLKLNMSFYKLFKLVDHRFRLNRETNHGKHYSLKDRIMPTLRYKLIQEQMNQVKRVDASKAGMYNMINVVLPTGTDDDLETPVTTETSVFNQLLKALQSMDEQQLSDFKRTDKEKKPAEEEKKEEEDDDMSLGSETDESIAADIEEEDGFKKEEEVKIPDVDKNSFKMFRDYLPSA